MCFTAATGDPVMVVIIFASSSDKIDPLWVKGIDIMQAPTNNIEDSIEFLKEAHGESGICGGAPKCRFRGKVVDTHIDWLPHGGIDSAMLVRIFKKMDDYNIFERTENLNPFVLLDGHHSRFEVDFLQYIINDAHKWHVCIGIPYGTHLWQIGDSTEQNGTYKIAEYERKQQIFQRKRELMQNPSIRHTDIVPIVKYACSKSFFKTKSNKRAITDRGWNPLNRALLQHPAVLKTRSIGEGTDILSTDDDIVTVPNSLNWDTGTSAEILDRILIKQNNDASRKRHLEKIRLAEMATASVQRTTKLTSGQLFRRDQVGLTDRDVLNEAISYQKYKQRLADEKSKRSKARILSLRSKATKICRKEESKWTLSDYKSMLTYKKKPGDEGSSKITDRSILQGWWQQRKDRPSPFASPSNSDDDGDDDVLGIKIEEDDLEIDTLLLHNHDGQAAAAYGPGISYGDV